jgi:hypothetical protein
VAAHEENSWPPTGINLSAYKEFAVAADTRRARGASGAEWRQEVARAADRWTGYRG